MVGALQEQVRTGCRNEKQKQEKWGWRRSLLALNREGGYEYIKSKRDQKNNCFNLRMQMLMGRHRAVVVAGEATADQDCLPCGAMLPPSSRHTPCEAWSSFGETKPCVPILKSLGGGLDSTIDTPWRMCWAEFA